MPQTEFDTQVYEEQSTRFVVPFTAFGAALTYKGIPILPRFVKNVRVLVSKAFDVSTSIKVGDTAVDDCFLTVGMLDPKVLGRVENSFHNGAEDQTSGVTTFVAAEEGKNYAAGGAMVLTRQATTDTVGEFTITITYDGYAPVARGMVDHQNPTYGKGDMDTVAWAGAADYTKPPAIP